MYNRKYLFVSAPATVFIVSRLFRLLPMFLIFNFLAILVRFCIGSETGLERLNITLFPNLLIFGYASLPVKPLGPAWSLDIELQFYLLFPLLALIIPVLRNKLPLAVGLLLLGGLGYIACFVEDISSTVLPYLGFFGIGIWAAWSAWSPCQRDILVALAGVGLILTVILAVPHLRGLLIVTDTDLLRGWNASTNAVTAVLLSPLAVYSVRQPSSRTDRLMGDLPYTVYCSHWIPVILTAKYLAGAPVLTKLPIVGCAIAVTYAVSLAALMYIDRPIGILREMWVNRHLEHSPKRSGSPLS